MTIETTEEAWRQNLSGRFESQLALPRPADWWTGLPPSRSPGLRPDGTLTSLPLPDLARCTRSEVQAYFDNGWTLTELLFSGLIGEEAFYRPPYHHLRHPMLFYYCHPPALYVNKLRVAGLIDAPINPYFERIFETGVDEMRWDDMSKNTMLWPSFDEAHAYRKTVYRRVGEVIAQHPDLADGHAPITQAHPLWALFMGFEHERIHLETSSVLMHELPLNLLRRPDAWPALHPSARRSAQRNTEPQPGRDYPELELLSVPATTVHLGKPADWPSYGWDNEYGSRTVEVQPFRAGKRLVTNGEFHRFVAAGGYREARWWSATGWEWRKYRNIKWPTFWLPEGPAGYHQYRLRTLFEVIEMPWDWPAEVNWHEASAYCAWLSERDGEQYRLLSEAEHNALRDPVSHETDDPVMAADGRTLLHDRGLNLNLGCGSSSPVDAGRPTAKGFRDVFGNVWQWLADHFNPLPGAQVHPYYDDFSSPCYDGQHQMILGGSWVSTGDEASVWSRFHFRPHFFQHAGFRVVQAEHDGGAVRLDTEDAASQVYESAQMVDDYLLLHFGSAAEQMPFDSGPRDACQFPQRCARWLIEGARASGAPMERALDIGCAVGGASFELARAYREVLGVDLSRAFIDTADALKRNGVLEHFCRDEGELGHHVTAQIDPAIARKRVSFRQADACSLPTELADYDAVLISNLLCRLPSPRSLLGRLGGPRGLVRVGGMLAIFSPYTWLEQFTPRGAWLGGYSDAKGPVHSADTLRVTLAGDGFELVKEAEFPLLIREHVRKYQYIVTHALLCRRVR
ncbi:MAG TPA: 5-histidylcysteine sulfoxide synthase [Aromatoleum sp.]|uniref:5-histidylcysteine sulfoxide synthase n=1 Tax=Aromatoleum sp. TaxID=2307007 RepID=UPI002B478EC2|nr:5-histidylcysteine sulfoxide synthase [Aromatoleum sp.]HJV27465.1 5-histidylcysteine sulfoxide synthase [Aromatoleum sp.]